jgi:hypothetical protein
MTGNLRITCLAVLVAVAACRERGTVAIVLDQLPAACFDNVVGVYAYLAQGAVCGNCSCTETCPSCDTGRCVRACGGEPCPIDEVLAHGIVFDPPAAGTYAAIYKLRAASGQEVGVVCADVLVDSDGTTSRDVTPMYAECCAIP